jgi:hypothetical protein
MRGENEPEERKRKKWVKAEKDKNEPEPEKKFRHRTGGTEGMSPPRRTATTSWSTSWKLIWIGGTNLSLL